MSPRELTCVPKMCLCVCVPNGTSHVDGRPAAEACESHNNSPNFFLTTPPLQKWLGIDHICS